MGRATIEDKPLTEVERNRRYRQRKRGHLPDLKRLSNEEIIICLRAEIRALRGTVRKLEEQLRESSISGYLKRHSGDR